MSYGVSIMSISGKTEPVMIWLHCKRKPYAMQWHYNMVYFLQNSSYIHPINSLPMKAEMGFFYQFKLKIHVLHQPLQFCVQYHVVLDCIIMAPNHIAMEDNHLQKKQKIRAMTFLSFGPHQQVYSHQTNALECDLQHKGHLAIASCVRVSSPLGRGVHRA